MPIDARDYPDFAHLTARSLRRGFWDALCRAEKNIARIGASRKPATFENTIEAIEHELEDVTRFLSLANICDNLRGGKAYARVQVFISDYIDELYETIRLNKKLMARLRSFDDKRETLTWQQACLLNAMLNYFPTGYDADPVFSAYFQELEEKSTALSSRFLENLNHDTYARPLIVSSRQNLSGIPADMLAVAKHKAQSMGLTDAYAFLTDKDSFIKFMDFADSRALRKRMYRAHARRATGIDRNNWGIAAKILSLRSEQASQMGHKHYVSYALSRNRIMRFPKDITNMLASVRMHAKSKAKQELADFKQLAFERDGIRDFGPWDIYYYSNLHIRDRLQIDLDKMREYLPLDAVLNGLFEHMHKLAGYKFRLRDDLPGIVPDARTYEITRRGKPIGFVCMDIFARTGRKSSGAASYVLQPHYIDKAGREHLPICVIQHNFIKGTKSKPTLLTTDDVEEMFHEMGHGLENLGSKQPYHSLASLYGPEDATEIVSLFSELYVQIPSLLRSIMRHYKTGEQPSYKTIRAIADRHKIASGWKILKQMETTAVDMAVHKLKGPITQCGLKNLERTARAPYTLFPKTSGVVPIVPAQDHLFYTGYDANFYNYLFSEIIAADLLSKKQTYGHYGARLSGRFTSVALGQNAVVLPSELLKHITGHAELNINPYIAQYSLAA